jgi:hypothetical protein
VAASADGRRYFMIDPDWHPWHDNGFPPFGQVGANGLVRFERGRAHHDSFHLTRSAMAVLSKPGGGTLMDSLAAATPLVLLDPFGDHESRNAALWTRLGFGIPFADWARHAAGAKSRNSNGCTTTCSRRARAWRPIRTRSSQGTDPGR